MFTDYHILLAAGLSGLAAGLAKVVLETIKGNFDWKYINTYGGMPSMHTAIMTGMAMTIGLQEGWSSTTFAIGVVVTVLIMRDAIGFRMHIGQNARAINKLIEALPVDERKQYPIYEEQVGHTPPQVAVGALIGIAVALVMNAAV